jgi:flagellar motility protein MotE (MotC chaperone)
MKAFKTFSVIILIILLLAGAWLGLLYFKILKTPNFMAYIPVVNNLLIEEDELDTELTPLDKAKKENAVLKTTITEKQEEIKAMQEQINDLKKQLKTSDNEAFKLKDEVARLNEEILDLKISKGNKKAAYKDMAGYFAEMKAQDAADILSRLKDEDIIGIFNEMPKDLVAEMLQKMDRDKATTLTRKMLVTEP